LAQVIFHFLEEFLLPVFRGNGEEHGAFVVLKPSVFHLGIGYHLVQHKVGCEHMQGLVFIAEVIPLIGRRLQKQVEVIVAPAKTKFEVI
jgi:hypothetical protein